MTTYPSVLILDGNHKFKSIDDRLVQQSRLVVATHPKRRNLFTVLKSRTTEHQGNITRKTLDKLITANL